MKAFQRVRDFIWPLPDVFSPVQEEEMERRRIIDCDAIRSANFGKKPEVFLEQARQLYAMETERRRGADTKASIYMAVIAAIVPMAASLITSFFDKPISDKFSLYQLILVAECLVAVIYLLGAAYWSFKALQVSTHSRVDTPEMVKAAKSSMQPDVALAKELLLATRLNRDGVNKKTTDIIMAQSYMLRTFISFILLILTMVVYQPLIWLTHYGKLIVELCYT
ncbi:hypothetical protein FHW72_001901 [Ochrobactrum sp. RC6B]|nr:MULTISPECIES: hypothetical protein [Brucella/Ochrobactrum group]MBB3216830.1 hypothetical protein [Ochrobactrum sp. RC6B]